MKTYKNLYSDIYSLTNLFLAWKKAKKEKTKKDYVIEFEKNLLDNLIRLQEELKSFTYKPRPLKTFILRDPKIRRISKSDFRDRVIHHALCNIIEPIFDKMFIYDSCANRKGKGNLKAIERFYIFIRKVSRNGKINGRFNDNQVKGYCLRADIRHYFQEVNHEILVKIIRRKIQDEKVIWLIEQILANHSVKDKGMPLGNLTSQFFANVYLNELDYFVKHKLKARYFIRYVDDFIILHSSKSWLEVWKKQINDFLNKELKIELHKEKTKIITLSRGIDFVGFRNFYYFRLLKKRNIRKMLSKIYKYKNGEIQHNKLIESFQGWQAYAKWANTYKLRNRLLKLIDKN
jgi:retron-type reverse transcriptase